MGLYRGQKRRPAVGTARFSPVSEAVKAGVIAILCGFITVSGASTSPTLSSCGLVSAAYADQETASTGKTVTLELERADLHQVIGMLQQQTGAEIVIQDGDKPFSKVNLHLEHASLEKALRNIAISANATVSRNEDGVYIIRPMSGESNDSLDNSQFSQDNPGSVEASGYAPSSELHWQKIILQHAVPRDILKIMHWDDGSVDDGPPTLQLPVTHPVITTADGVTTQYSEPMEVPAVPIGHGSTGSSQANRSPDYDSLDQVHQFPGYGGQQGYQGGGYQGGAFPGGGFARNGFPGAAGGFGAQTGGPAGNGNLPEGVTHIYALQGDNSLFVEATPEGFDRIKEIVKSLDVAPRQVQIKVEYVTAQVSDVDGFGINFNLIPYPGVTASTNLAGVTGANDTAAVSIASGNMVAQMFFALTKDRSKIVEAPLITTTNNVPASIQVTQQIPYTTTNTIIPSGGGIAQTNTTQQFLSVPTGLSVNPRINADDTVTLQLAPTITAITGPAAAGSPPPTSQQTLTTLRTVRNGETIVIGGLINKTETYSQTKVPLLGDLPIIGNIFRTRVVNTDDLELLIFVTPTIIGDSVDTTEGVAP